MSFVKTKQKLHIVQDKLEELKDRYRANEEALAKAYNKLESLVKRHLTQAEQQQVLENKNKSQKGLQLQLEYQRTLIEIKYAEALVDKEKEDYRKLQVQQEELINQRDKLEVNISNLLFRTPMKELKLEIAKIKESIM